MRGIPRSHRFARSRPLTLKRRGRTGCLNARLRAPLPFGHFPHEWGQPLAYPPSFLTQYPVIPTKVGIHRQTSRGTPDPQRRGTPLWLPRCGAGYARRTSIINVPPRRHARRDRSPRGSCDWAPRRDVWRQGALGVPRPSPGQPQGRAPTGALHNVVMHGFAPPLPFGHFPHEWGQPLASPVIPRAIPLSFRARPLSFRAERGISAWCAMSGD